MKWWHFVFARPTATPAKMWWSSPCHGGSTVSSQLLRACLDAGAQAAGPGEFTKRALLAGRISLTQAEAVMDLIGSTSKQERPPQLLPWKVRCIAKSMVCALI